MVRYAHSTCDTSSIQFLLPLSNRALIPFPKLGSPFLPIRWFGVLNGCKSLFDIDFITPVFEWVISELLSVFRYDLPWTSPITAYHIDLILMARAFFVSAGNVSYVRYLSSGIIHEYPSSTTARISFSLIDFSFNTSTKTFLVRWAKLVDAILQSASAFLFSLL
ncbi:hypothetical protein Tco_0558979, partial [Tanacetum coccineum]